MSGVPYTFGNATTSIPLSQLDVNFATNATLGNASVGLGNTTTTVGNLTVSNVTINGLSGGTANGVAYLNGSNVVTTGTALTFDGTNLTLGNNPISFGAGYTNLTVSGSSGGALYVTNGSNTAQGFVGVNSSALQIGSQTNIPIAFYVNNAERSRIDSSGNLLVNNTSAAAYSNGIILGPNLGTNAAISIGHASGTPSGAGYCLFGYNGSGIGSITQNSTTGVLYNITSDRRLKSNIGNVTTSGTFIDSLIPRTFTWTSTGESDVGFIADEYQSVLPSAVTGQANAIVEIGTLAYSNSTVIESNIEQPSTIPEGQTWTATGTKDVYQQVDFTTSAMIANMIAELQSLRHRVAALEAKVGT